MTPKYTLTIYLGANKTSERKIMFVAKESFPGWGCKMTLVELDMVKEMYRPACLKATVQVSPVDKTGADAGEVSSIRLDNLDNLLGKHADLSDGAQNIVQDYIILDYVPEYRTVDAKTSLYVTLFIYSPDKILSLKKYNQVYVAKKLGAQIFTSVAAQYPNEIPSATCAKLHNIVSGTEEFIQPYLVQYDEPLLDFLARTANRCGEFLYYEKGTWQLGHDTTQALAKRREITAYASLTFHRFKESQRAERLVTNYIKQEATSDANKNAGMQSYTGPAEEYLHPYKEKPASKTAGSFASSYNAPAFYVGKIISWLAPKGLGEIAGKAVMDIAFNNLMSFCLYKGTIDTWNKTNVTPFENDNERAAKGDDGLYTVNAFSNLKALSDYASKFYLSVREHGETAKEKAIHLQLGTDYRSILLGDILTVQGVDYVVTNISLNCQMKTVVKDNGDTTTSPYTTCDIDAAPLIGKQAYPIPLGDGIRRAEQMTAIVTSNDDPLEMGRIQIRYPWQPESQTPSSPWIRTALPYASKSSAMRFAPQPGDEVMIGYEFGNIERPYMVGALQSTENNGNQLRNSLGEKENYMINTPNGHYIRFYNPKNMTNFLKGLLPLYSSLITYLPFMKKLIALPSDSSAGKEFSGGITLGDAYGFYKIETSTDKRTVNIQSSLGTVNINAFTGITISAPNGNVKIVGKNVEIEAGNTLKITSGANVPAKKEHMSKWQKTAKAVGGAAMKFVEPLIKPVDLSLVRSTVEAFVKPIGGTMLIKSNRFMRLEAGSGTTKIPYTAYPQRSDAQLHAIELNYRELFAKVTLNAVRQIFDIFDRFEKDGKQTVAQCSDSYILSLERLKQSILIDEAHALTYDNGALADANAMDTKVDTAEEIVNAAREANSAEDAATAAREKIDKLSNDANDNFTNRKTETASAAETLAQAAWGANNIIRKSLRIGVLSDDNADDGAGIIHVDATLHDYLETGRPDNGSYVKYLQDVGACVEHIWRNIIAVDSMEDYSFDCIRKRRIIYKVLKYLQDNKYLTIRNDDAHVWSTITSAKDDKHEWKSVNVENEDEVCIYTHKWTQFLRCVKVYDENETTSLALNALKAYVDIEPSRWRENHINNPQNEGEILFSDTAGNTSKVVEGQVKMFRNSQLADALGALFHL